MAADSSENARRIRDNLAQVRERIAAAAARSGRPADQITLVGVTKYVEPPTAQILFESGLQDLGESRPQELWRKSKALYAGPHGPRWHLIGHLQRRKVKRTLQAADWIHSVDSLALLESIYRESGPAIHVVLLEVNISGEPSKQGFRPDEMESVLTAIVDLEKINFCDVCGLMTMAGLEGGKDRARRDFAALRELRDKLRPICPTGLKLNQLSMGMSGDYEIAVEEGATIVRIGSALFEGVES